MEFMGALGIVALALWGLVVFRWLCWFLELGTGNFWTLEPLGFRPSGLWSFEVLEFGELEHWGTEASKSRCF